MAASSGVPGGGRLGGKVAACGAALLLAAGLAARALEAAFGGEAPAAAFQGVLALAALAAAYALWVRAKRASDERVLWEMRVGRRDRAGCLIEDEDEGEGR